MMELVNLVEGSAENQGVGPALGWGLVSVVGRRRGRGGGLGAGHRVLTTGGAVRLTLWHG